jgi:hypothetical protein
VKAARVLPFHRRAKADPPVDGPAERPNVAVPLFAAAFCLGTVVAAAGLLGLQSTRGDTVPAEDYRAATEARAAAEAAAAARLAALDDAAAALDDADDLAHRLVAALASPPVSPADLADLRREVATQTRTVERVRVVRVPVPGPTVTAPPVAQRPQPARQDRPSPAPGPTPQVCALELLGTCLAR